MKRFIYPVLTVVISVFAFNCQRELSFPGDTNPGGNTPAPVKATIQGRVLDENSQPANGVVVKVAGTTVTTDARGYFRIVKASLDKNASLVTAEKTGYFKSYRTFQATTGANHVVIKLIKKTVIGTVSSSSGGEATLSNGAKISLPANGVVKAAGNSSYSGTINVYAAYINPTSIDIGQTVPGSFMADDKDGKRVTLASYGMLAVELESATGEKLQIATGKTATLTSPIPSSILSSAPPSVALWYVDEQTGIWKEEGTATKAGNNYVGDVKHFSFWNCDAGFPGINLSLTLKDSKGIPFVHALVQLTRPGGGWWSSSAGYTDSLGKVSGLVPSNETLLLEVMNDCGNSIYSQNIGPFTQNTDMGTITVTASVSSLLTIKGRVLNCSGAAVSNGVAIISYDGWPRYVSTNNSGDFSLAIIRCAGAPSTCDITAVDNTAQQQATVNGIIITTPITDAGNITACGTSAAQYINYTLDGTNYSITSAAVPDSLMGFTYQQGTSLYQTSIMGYQFSNNKNINFSFSSTTAAPGTYPLTGISVQNVGSGVIISPSNVVLTNFPSVSGGFYEGNFSGSFRDSLNTSPVHTVNGSFRVRRY